VKSGAPRLDEMFLSSILIPRIMTSRGFGH
jgi:hypothetical protein